MTNKKLKGIKPFMIDCTGFSKGQVVEIFDKMVEAGIPVDEGIVYERFEDCSEVYEYYLCDSWGCTANGTHTANKSNLAVNTRYITLDQLDKHLGLNPSIPPQELRNVKIDLRNADGIVDEELSKAFQEAVFASGGQWFGSGVDGMTIQFLDKPFMLISDIGDILHCSGYDYFSKDLNTQITFTYERKLEWAATVFEQESKRAIIELPSGDKYYADELEAALGMIKKID